MKIFKTTTSFLIFFLFSTISSISQNIKIDSLKIELQNHKERDTVRANLLNDLAYLSYKKNTDKAMAYLEESEVIAKTIDFKKGRAKSVYIKGVIQVMQSNYDEGLQYFNEALQLYETIHYKLGISECYNTMGLLFYEKGERKEAISYYYKAISIDEEIGNKEGVSANFNSIGVSYVEMGNYTEAIAYYEKALKISKKINNEARTSRCLLNIGNVYIIQGNYPLALEYHNKSLTISEKRKDSLLISLSLNNIGHIYGNLKNYDKAITYSEKALEIQKKKGDKKRSAETSNNLGLQYIQLKKYKQAHKVLMEALVLSEEIKNKYIAGMTLNNIGYVYLHWKDYNTSLEYYEKAQKTNLSIDSKRGLAVSYFGLAKVYRNLKKYGKALTNALKGKYLSQEIKIMESERDIQQELSIIYQNTGRYRDALASHQQFKILNDSIFNKENIKKITQLEYEYKYQKALDSASIRELKLTKTVASTNKDLEKTKQNYLWAIIAFLLISIILGSIIFFQKLRNAKSKTQNVVIEQKLLRSQMTPHFIFNSLSVLQGMILNKEKKKSVYYLSKFSKLLRIILENSRDLTVSLSKELTAIQHYLALQNLENEAYQYTVLVEDTIDVTLFEIPPMLIQPFVENALEHAFINQIEDRKIDIRLTYLDKKLICTITDNGIGINAQKESKNQYKKSLATTITSERLKILSNDLKIEGSVIIENRQKYNEKGTQVTLVIPHKILVE